MTQQSLESKAITPTEAHGIMVVASVLTADRRVNEKWSLYFRLLWETGLRPSEGLALRHSDIGTDMRLTVHRLKKKDRPEDKVPVQPALRLALLDYAQRHRIRQAGRLFPNTIQAATQMFHRCRDRAGCRPHLTLHGFRHGFAYNYIRQSTHQSSADTMVRLQRALGHSSLTTTSIYARPGVEQVADDIQKMRF